MTKIKIDDRVSCNNAFYAGEYTGAAGKVKDVVRLSPDECMFIVQYRDGTKKKIPREFVELIRRDPMDDMITISRKQYRQIVEMNFSGSIFWPTRERLKNLEMDLFGSLPDNHD